MDNMDHVTEIYEAVLNGDMPGTKSAVEAALSTGIPAKTILTEGLIAAMDEVGQLFETQEFFVPDMLVAARAMQAGMALLKPHLVESGAQSVGRAVLGTVKGDLHDIGKNLVGMMLEGAGFEVIDLGIDVAPDKFVQAVREQHPDVLAMSALLTTTMRSMAGTIKALQEAGLRDQVKVMVGGAPVNEEFAKQIGADGYGPDAGSAARVARALINKAESKQSL